MLAIFARLTLLLSLIAGLLITLIRAQPAPITDWQRLTRPKDCRMPCFLGVEMGVTSASESYARLKRHPWIETVTLYVDFNTLAWTWSGAQPNWIDASQRGSLQLYRNRAQSVRVYTRIPFGEITRVYDQPDTGVIVPLEWSPLLSSYDFPFRVDDFMQPNNSFIVEAYLPCSLSRRAFWSQPVRLRFTVDTDTLKPHTSSTRAGSRMVCVS